MVIVAYGQAKTRQGLMGDSLSLSMYSVYQRICTVKNVTCDEKRQLCWYSRSWPCPQIRWRYGIKNKAAITLQHESNVKLIAALLFCIVVLYEQMAVGVWPQNRDFLYCRWPYILYFDKKKLHTHLKGQQLVLSCCNLQGAFENPLSYNLTPNW